MRLLLVCLLASFLLLQARAVNYSPSWVSCPDTETGSFDIYFETFTVNMTVNFKSAFASKPQTAYGMQSFLSLKGIIKTFFYIKVILVYNTHFIVENLAPHLARVSAKTSRVRYLAVANTFDYPFTVIFHSVYPGNQVAGTNITVVNSILNFTAMALAAPSTFTLFAPPYSDYQIMPLITCINLTGTNDTGGPEVPLFMYFTPYIIDNQRFNLQLNFGSQCNLIFLHMSMLIFHKYANTSTFRIHYGRFEWQTLVGGNHIFPPELVNNTMLGMDSYFSNASDRLLDFELAFTNTSIDMVVNNTPGVFLDRYSFAYIYFGQPLCLNNDTYDPVLNLCINSDPAIIVPNGTNSTNTTTPITLQPTLNPSLTILTSQSCNTAKLTMPLPIANPSSITIMTPSSNVMSWEVVGGSQLVIYFQYFETIHNRQLVLQIDGLYYTVDPQATQGFVPLVYYEQSECSAREQMDSLVIGIEVTAYLVLFFSLISVKIVGLELFNLLQLVYFSLPLYDFMPLYMEPFRQFSMFNGYNTPMIADHGLLPDSIEYIGVHSYFLNNFNVMLFVMGGYLLVSTVLYLITKFAVETPTLHHIARCLLKQGFLTLLIFNLPNMAFSIGTFIKYGEMQTETAILYYVNYVVIGILLFGSVSAIAFFMASNTVQDHVGYGEFRKKFKGAYMARVYIPISIGYRIFMGLYVSQSTQNYLSTLAVLLLCIGFFIYHLVMLPFGDFYQNYRACLLRVTEIAVLLCANFYRSMKLNHDIEAKSRIMGPAFVLFSMIALCIGVSLLVLAYEIAQVVRKCRNRRRVIGSEKQQGSSLFTIENVKEGQEQ